MTSVRETEQVYSYNSGARTGWLLPRNTAQSIRPAIAPDKTCTSDVRKAPALCPCCSRSRSYTAGTMNPSRSRPRTAPRSPWCGPPSLLRSATSGRGLRFARWGTGSCNKPIVLSRSVSLSVLTAIFQVNLGKPVFSEAKDDGSGGDNWSYRSCKAPVKSSPPTNHHPAFLQTGCPSCRPTNSVKALKGSILLPVT